VRPIQYLLAALVLAGMLVYFARLRSRLADRLIVLLLGAAGLVLVAFPELANRLAEFAGVWRGADLVVYVALLGLAWTCLVLLSRLRELDARLTELARAIALLTPHFPYRPTQHTLEALHQQRGGGEQVQGSRQAAAGHGGAQSAS